MTRPKWRHKPPRKGLARAKEERLDWARVIELRQEESMSKHAAEGALIEARATQKSRRTEVVGGGYLQIQNCYVLFPNDARGDGGLAYVLHEPSARMYRTRFGENDKHELEGTDPRKCTHAPWLMEVLGKREWGRTYLERSGYAPWAKPVPTNGDHAGPVPKHASKIAEKEARAAAHAARTSGSGPVEPAPEPKPSHKERAPVALIEVKTKETKVVMVEGKHEIPLGRNELVALLRQSGADDMPKNVRLTLIPTIRNQGSWQIGEEEEFKLLINWETHHEETKESERSR